MRLMLLRTFGIARRSSRPQRRTRQWPVTSPRANLLSTFFSPSIEQRAVVESLRTSNVLVSARPGAGKTATAEAVLQANSDRPVAVITYSKRLQLDTQKRLMEYPLADVFTFHGLASRLFGKLVHNDSIFRDLRDKGVPPAWAIPPYSLVILDEIQDLTEDLYWLACTFVSAIARTHGQAPRLLVLGDPKQAIYDFRGADERYLELSPSNFASLSPYDWQSKQLSTSFRLSRNTARFINNAFLGGETYIEGSHTGPKPLYVHANLIDADRVVSTLIPLIRKYGHENTAILAPTVRANVFLKLIVNKLLTTYQIPSAPGTADYGLDEDTVRGKLIPSTYHQFKGSERDLVIVLGVDASYFHFIARDLHDDRCPNATFVALTRARKQLVVLQSHEYPAMPFMDWKAMERHADFVNLVDTPPKPQYKPGRPLQLGLLLPTKVAVTDAARHVRDEELDRLVQAELKIVVLSSPLPPVACFDAPEKVCSNPGKNMWEPVSDLNGLAVTADFELWLTGAVTAFNRAKSTNSLTPAIVADERRRAVWFSREAAYYESVSSGYKSRWSQLSGHAFDWLAPYLRPATLRLADQFSDFVLARLRHDIDVEVSMSQNIVIGDQKTRLAGRADLVHERGKDDTTIWEIKFVSALTNEHVIQTVLYGYLWSMKTKRKAAAPFPKLVLYNVKNNEKWEIITTREKAWKVIVGVLVAKYISVEKESAEAFLKKCAKVRGEAEKLVAKLGV